MSKEIENPAECEVWAVIRFLNAQNVRPIEIYRQLIAVYGQGVMNESDVRKWCRMFNECRANVPDARPSSLAAWKTGLNNTCGHTGVSLLINWWEISNFLFADSWNCYGASALKTGSVDWRQITTMQAYRNSSHDTTSAWIFMGIMYKDDLTSVVMM
jgi:hypothetical protein